MKKTVSLWLFAIAFLLGSWQSYGQNYVLDFPGSSSDAVVIPDDPALDISTEVTMEAWINANSWRTQIWEGTIVGKPESDVTGYTIRCGDNGNLQINLGMGGVWVDATSTGGPMQTGVWYHVAGTFDGTTLRVFINGVQVGSNATSGTIGTNTRPLEIGRLDWFNDRYFDGLIDEVRIWDKALSASTLSAWMNGVTSAHPNYSDLVAYYKMEDNLTTTVVKDSAGTHDATILGSVTYVGASLSCLSPVILSTGVTATTADVNWSGNATQYQYEYDTAGFPQGTGTLALTTDTFANLTGLQANTGYDFYVRAICGPNDTSSWVQIGFSTPCVAVGIPYSEDYSVWPLNCWDLSGGTQQFSDGGGYARANYWGWPSGNDALMTSPLITVSQNARLKFKWSHLYNTTYPLDGMILRAQVSGSSTWDTLWLNAGSTFNSNDGAGNTSPGSFVEEILLLDSATYTGKDVSFQFIANSGFGPDAFIDDFLVEAVPACQEPLSPTLIAATDSTITLSWISNVDSFDVEWGPVGFGQGTGTGGGFGDDTTTIPGLMSNTCYDFYIRSNCLSSGNGNSVWVGPYTFCTDCLPVTALPWSEDFDVNGLNCWTVIDQDGDGQMWVLDTLSQNANSGSNSAAVNSPFFGSSNDWLIAPRVTLTGNERMSYYLRTLSNFDDVELTVLLSTTNDSIQNFTDTLVPQTTISGSTYTQTQAILSAYTGDVYIAFAIGLPQGFNSGELRLDDVLIEALPPCLEPDSLSLVIASSNYVVVDWAPGGGTSWNVEYGVPGYTPGTGTTFNTNVTTDTVNGLSPATDYDIYIQSDCGTNGTSIWIGPLSVRTACVIQSLPFLEDFNTDLGCMVAIDGGNGTDTWVWSAAGGTTTNGDLDGTGYAIVDSDEFGDGQHMIEMLNSPPIDAGSLPSTSSLVVEWDQFYDHIGADSAEVQVFDGTSWITVLKMQQDFGGFGAPDHRLIDATPYANANFQVRFVYNDADVWAWHWAVDNFSVTEALCGFASNLDTTFALPTSVGLDWTSNGSNWNIEWGPTGFVQGTGTGDTIQNVTAKPYVLTGLQPSTCYDYYVQDTCPGIGNGIWAGPFTFCTPASCPAPSNLTASNITLNSFDISWTAGGVGANYNVEYGLNGFSPGSGTLIATTTTTTTISTGITPSTTYDIYVQDSCGLGDVSFWIGPITVSTLCATFLPPYLEDFDANGFVSGAGFNNAGDAINSCWFRTDNTGGGNFLGARTGTTGSGGTGPSSGVNGTGYVFYEASGSAVGDTAWLNTPVFDLSGTTSPFFKYQYHMFGGDIGDLTAQIDTGNGWMTLNTIAGQQQLAETDPWLTDSIDITTYIASSVQFRFIVTSGGGFESDIAIENVEVADALGASCPDPIGLDTANVSCIGADLIWTSSSSTIASAIEYGPAGFTPGTGAGIIVANASSPETVGNLMPGTAYEFYVVDFCANDTSGVVGPFSFTTANGPISAAFTFNQTDTTLVDADMNFDGSGSIGATSYAWNYGDGNTGTGMNPTHTYSTNGTYMVTLVISGDCGVDSISQQVVIAGISLAENRLGRSLEVYPNPTTTKVNVSFSTIGSDDARIYVMDLSGKVILSVSEANLNGKYEGTIDISALAKGTYLMKIESGDLTTQRRIIKQ